MKTVAAPLALLAMMLLPGCWVGPDFYADEPPARPIEEGRYRIVDTYAMLPDAEQALWMNEPVFHRVTVSYDRDGTALVANSPEEADGPQRARIVALDRDEGLYVAAIDPGEGEVEMGSRVYALLMMRPDGYRVAVPPCDGTRRLGDSPVIVSGPLFGLRCRYDKRADFEKAMRDYARDPVSWTEYRRID